MRNLATFRRVGRTVGLIITFNLRQRAIARIAGQLRAQSCHCLCPRHRPAGMFCDPDQGMALVTLIGGHVSPCDVPMCSPCAAWWQAAQPHRVTLVVGL